jgi:hypothetical protein
VLLLRDGVVIVGCDASVSGRSLPFCLLLSKQVVECITLETAPAWLEVCQSVFSKHYTCDVFFLLPRDSWETQESIFNLEF